MTIRVSATTGGSVGTTLGIKQGVTVRAGISQLLTKGDKTFIFEQGIPSETWEIAHTLNKYPSVTIVDSMNTVVIGSIQYIEFGKIIVTFNGKFSGKAYLN